MARTDKETVVVGPNFLNSWFVYDYEICDGEKRLQKVIDTINRRGYDLVTVTQYVNQYTVFFRRRACG